MRHVLLRAAALGVSIHAIACGAGGDGGGPSCALTVIVSPAQPVRGNTVELAVDVALEELSGFQDIQWSVRYGGAEVVLAANGDERTFLAGQAGIYEILVTGTVGGVSCEADQRSLNVTESGAMFTPMRLVVVPRDRSLVPPQAIDFDLPGGADYTLSTVGLSAGVSVSAVLRDSDNQPLAAYVRSAPVGSEPFLWTEIWSGADGLVELRLLNGSHELLIVPEGGLAPIWMPVVEPSELNASIVIPDGVNVSGTVEDGSGDPVPGARVQLVVDGAPSTVDVTDAGGGFTVSARAGTTSSVTVVPDPASGLPALELDTGGAIGGGSTIAVQIDPIDLRTIDPDLRESDGTTPAAGARVTFVARSIAGAGTISIDGASHPARGELTRTVLASGTGGIPAQLLPATQYDVLVEPGPTAPVAEGVRLAPLDLSTGSPAPATLRLAARATVTGQVVNASGAPIEGARVVATPRGLLARATRAGDTAVSDADGMITLRLAGTVAAAAPADYELRLDGAAAGAGRTTLLVTTPAPGDQIDILAQSLPATLRLDGTLSAPGGVDVAGAQVELWCRACGPGESAMVVAEAVTSAAGEFVMRAPDPGVSE
jgi:hypothetical protein